MRVDDSSCYKSNQRENEKTYVAIATVYFLEIPYIIYSNIL